MNKGAVIRFIYTVFAGLTVNRYRADFHEKLFIVTVHYKDSAMFRIDFNFIRRIPERKPRPVSDAVFRRKLDTSATLRHMCGFDSELYQAINGLER